MSIKYDVDKQALQPIETLFLNLDTQVPDTRYGAKPGAKVALKHLLREDIVRGAMGIYAEYLPLANVEERRKQHAAELERCTAVQAETWRLASEMSLLLQAAAVRHPEVEEKCQPRIGRDSGEQAANLGNMSARVEENKVHFAAQKIDLHLWPSHAPAPVAKQLAAHEAADQALRQLEIGQSADEKKRFELRARAEALQPDINIALPAAVGNDRSLLLKLGFQERTAKPRPRAAKPDDAGAGTPPAGSGTDVPAPAPADAKAPPAVAATGTSG